MIDDVKISVNGTKPIRFFGTAGGSFPTRQRNWPPWRGSRCRRYERMSIVYQRSKGINRRGDAFLPRLYARCRSTSWLRRCSRSWISSVLQSASRLSVAPHLPITTLPATCSRRRTDARLRLRPASSACIPDSRGVHLSGGRRPCRHRHRGDRTRGDARGEDHGDLR